LAASRHGVLAVGELTRGGVAESLRRRRVRQGVLDNPHRGVYVVSDLVDPLTPLAAAQLAFPFLVAERRTAALVWGLDGFRDPANAIADLVQDLPGRTRSQRQVPFRRATIPRPAITTHGGIRLTTPTWTLGELGVVVADADLVELALESALLHDLTTESKLHAVVAQRPPDTWPGSGLLAQALSRRRPGDPPTESFAETRFLQLVVRPAGLDDPERQVPIRVPGRSQPYWRDFVYRRGGRELDIEVDGMATHADPAAREQDLRRDELIIEAGCAVRRFSANRIEHHCAFVRRAVVTAVAQLSY
jgi:hypothetical protein